MNRDIENLDDITLLVKTFYDELCKNPVMDHLYNKVMKIDWEEHIPIMVHFWGSLVLRSGSYRGDIIGHHHHVIDKIPLTLSMFEQWEHCFIETLDSLFQGTNTEKTKKRVTAMTKSLVTKLNINS
ncbi:group III truncated hemoglobin [Halosquirtibacter xylanolyticus]|uniref:group III truncated hemoglobin n=1 Tax=Halosquirtibacter xylanolyticus TaxID=3374599 RepID=UPI0037488278|nr:group III truncated hemoglobin [Prolixibacteraceae bacterium]